ncbi:outer membrane beta-barrel protein [Bdellovibrio sp. HCB117]|uniref:outer membrane beta-barrel protein n=1 Tax=Bdellovibrio sp. HCB117 TaxID=3394359 RepID=UPI0039B46742
MKTKIFVTAASIVMGFSSIASAKSFKSMRNNQGAAGYSRMDAIEPRSSFVHLEPVIGYTSSTFGGVEGKNGAELENIGGMQAGLGLRLGRSQLQFETGLYYSERGAKLSNLYSSDGITIPGKATIEYKFKYLEAPLYVRYAFQDPEATHFFIKGGGVVGLLQEAKMNGTGGLTGSVDIKDSANETDFRAGLGVGGVLRINNMFSVLIQGDYQLGLNKVNKESAEGTEIKNSSVALSTGLVFDI